MTDDLARRFHGIDAPRPLPAQLRSAVLAELVDAPMSDELASADAPRALPAATRARLEGALTRGVGDRPMPVPFRRRLARSLGGGDQRRLRTALAAAAVLVALGGVATVVTGDDAADTPVSSRTASGGNVSGGNQSAGDSAVRGDASLNPQTKVGPSTGGATASGAASAARSAVGAAPVGVRLVAGDGEAEAAFRSYIADQPRLTITEGSAAPVVVNLSDTPTKPGAAVVMEGITAAEAQLQGAVFSAAGVVERQARIAARTAFPSDAAGERAVIVTGDTEPFASRIPDALESVLRARGVSIVRVGYDASLPALLPRAAATFVSLPTDVAREWLRDAQARSYAPPRGVWGVYSLADKSLVPVMPASVRVVSPFLLPTAGEGSALGSARAVHGWVTAKLLVAAVQRSGAATAPAIRDALLALRGFDDGFAAPLDFREGSNARTPEAVVLRPSNGSLVATGGFVRDAS